LGWENDSIPKSIQKTLFVQLNEEEQKMAEILQQRSKIHLDELALEVGQKISKTAAILMELEMQGVVRALPGKYYELI
jgi:DNA processing protein